MHTSYEHDKLTERDRYERRARALLARIDSLEFGPDGAASQPLAIRRPYIVFEEYVRHSVRPGDDVLDVCCGTGLFSLVAARAGAHVTAADIAEYNLTIAYRRAQRAGLSLQAVVADAERLPFADGSFDVVTCAGSLSYVDLEKLLGEITRLVRPGGSFICVDSLNHNPIYRLNRYAHYLRGHRTKSVISRTPTLTTVGLLAAAFPVENQTRFFGIFSWLSPLFHPWLGSEHTAALLDHWDDHLPALHRYAFKFVFAGRKSEV